MVVFMRRFEDCILKRLDGGMVDGYACLMMLEIMATITYREFEGFRRV
jgi:hypothetical protein